MYYVRDGVNIARELAPQVSNPRTEAQMRQRMQWANLVNFYKVSKGWMGRKSFESKPRTWSDYNAFMSANLGQTPVYLTKQVADNGGCILAPYAVTKGSLPDIVTRWETAEEMFRTSIVVDDTLDDGTTATVSQLTDSILARNSSYRQGDQLSFITMFNGRAYRPYVYAFELILDSSDNRTISELFGLDGQPFLYFGNGYIDVAPDSLENPTQGLAVGCAVVLSRTISGQTSVSSQSIVLNPDAQQEYQLSTTETAFETARESYGIGQDVFLDAGYSGAQGDGETSLIRSFTGTYNSDYSANPVAFTIVDGGRNTLRQSSQGGVTAPTPCTLVARGTLIADQDYCLAFNTPGQTPQSIARSAVPSNNTLTFSVPDTDAERIQRQAGTYSLYQSDTVEGAPIQVWTVSAD